MTKQILAPREPEGDVDPLFVSRWSPRAFSERPIPQEALDALFEAARWAPSSMNEQPWRYHLTTRGPVRDQLNAALSGWNQAWAPAAPALVIVTANAKFERNGEENRHALFDTGASLMQLTLQAQRLGLVTHAIGGIDLVATQAALNLADGEVIACAVAIGYPGDPETLPEGLRARETPSTRRPRAELVTTHI